MALHPGSNATADSAHGGGGAVTSADGIGGWGKDSAGANTLRLLVTAFNPAAKTADATPVTVQVAFERPAEWGGGAMQIKNSVLNRTTSPFDAIWADGHANGWLTSPSDANVYPLSMAEPHMLTDA